MKSMYLMIALAVSLLAGCARMSDVVGPAPVDEGTATVSFEVVMEKSGKLSKAQAVSGPTDLIVAWYLDGGLASYDTVGLTSGLATPTFVLKKGLKYNFEFAAVSSAYEGNFNSGSVSFTVNKDTSISVNLPTRATEMEVVVQLEGTDASRAVGTKAVWSRVTSGAPFSDSAVHSFAVGSVPKDTLSGIMAAGYAHLVTITIPLEDGSYYTGSGTTPVLQPGVDCSLEIVLHKYDPNGAKVSMALVIVQPGKAKVSVTFAKVGA